MLWFESLLFYGCEEQGPLRAGDVDVNLLPAIVEKVLISKLSGKLNHSLTQYPPSPKPLPSPHPPTLHSDIVKQKLKTNVTLNNFPWEIKERHFNRSNLLLRYHYLCALHVGSHCSIGLTEGPFWYSRKTEW